MVNKVDFDKYTDNYDEILHDVTGFFASSEAYFAQYKVDLVRKHTQGEVARVLEFGCGIGRNIPFLQKAFPAAKIVGTDISVAGLEFAKRAYPDVEFIPEDDTTEGKSGLFDIIFVAGVFHHVPKDQRASVARTLKNRLAPNGSIFVFEHNPYNPVTRRIVSNCIYDEDAILLRPSELKRILSATDLTVKDSSYCLFIPPSLPKLLKLENYLGWLPMGGQYWVLAQRS
jgi:SAM-dependent methyltransferase